MVAKRPRLLAGYSLAKCVTAMMVRFALGFCFEWVSGMDGDMLRYSDEAVEIRYRAKPAGMDKHAR